MTAKTLTPSERRSVALFTSGLEGFQPRLSFSKNDRGANALLVEDLPVFRSGTFSDSWGIQHTWEPLHMTQMVNNFDYLRTNGTFAHVPVRKGHGGFLADPMDSLVGWHTGLRTEEMKSPVDGQTYMYLLASFSLFDDDAILHVNNGDWPNRSSEVGNYVNNNESEYWPAYMGFAFVDIPAVEGLNFSKYAKEAEGKFSILVSNDKEFGVSAPTNSGPAAQNAGQNPLPDPLAGVPAAPAAAPAAAPVAPAAPAQHAAPASAPDPAPFLFKVAGKEVSDFAAVQAHIAGLEQFQSETLSTGRKNFVKGLAEGQTPKIAASQVESLTELALGMTDDQFSKFKKSYEDLPANPLFAQHGQPNGSGQTNGAPTPEDTHVADLKAIVGQHRLAGMAEEQLSKLPSYIELKKLDPSFK